MPIRALCLVVLGLSVGTGCDAGGRRLTLAGGGVSVELGRVGDGSNLIRGVRWTDDAPLRAEPARIVEGIDVKDALGTWFPRTIVDGAPARPELTWHTTDDVLFRRAEATRPLADGLALTWTVEAVKGCSMWRMHVRLTNEGSVPRKVQEFPAWTGAWKVAGGLEWIRWWRSLSFRRLQRSLTPGVKLALHSRFHSSDTREGGVNPYWIVEGDRVRLCFALAWCGGWRAELEGIQGGLRFDVRLPPEETQLTLEPGETVNGPMLYVTALPAGNEAAVRAEWMRQRTALARRLYGGPKPLYPLTYNNWYTTRFDLDGAFLKRQIAAMGPYDFDHFIIDAGWYKYVGAWAPDPKKFRPGQFEAICRSIKEKGAGVGIWSCPQFVHAPKDEPPPEADVPGFYRKFIDGHLLDLAGCGFTQRLLDHVAELRERYHMDWWKYDQDVFTQQTRHGLMKNVIAFQDALVAVRKAHPDLVIENCQSGGRMINELTLLLAESQWLKDGGHNGLIHARSNISVALGSMEFVPPWAANRWTNNFQRMPPANDELTRFYCRSAMAGTWGIVADLPKTPDRQREVILREIEHYHRLNELKASYLYDLVLPVRRGAVAGVTFYAEDLSRAAVLLYRWDRKGAWDHRIRFSQPLGAGTYTIRDVDGKESRRLTSEQIARDGVGVRFDEKRLSALIFLEK